MDSIEAHLKAAYPHALATLVRILGDIDRAEEALQEAATRAIEVWPRRGFPDEPVAWLVRSGRNCAVDGIRRQRVEQRYRIDALHTTAESGEVDPRQAVLSMHLRDDLLRLIFTCCHPELSLEERVAVTLKALGGLSVEEIAAAFLVKPRTMEQRLTRVGRRLRTGAIPYEAPRPEDLPARLESVRAVVYLVFNEGYKATAGADLIRVDLGAEAIRMARILVRAFPGDAETLGLLALVLLHDARRVARVAAAGEPVPIDEQDRSLWDRDRIAEGRALLEKALRHGRPGSYQVQAAISAVHGAAPSFAATDWDEIVRLYDLLWALQPSPVVALNRAVAVAFRDGPNAGLAEIAPLAHQPEMDAYLPFQTARAALLARAGKMADARAAYRRAAGLARNAGELAYLQRKLAELG